MKNNIYTILFLAILTFSCTDMLELKPVSTLIQGGYWESEEAVEAGYTGLCSSFRGKAFNFWAMGELRSDMWGGKTFESSYGNNLIHQTIDAENVPLSRWGNYYSVIHYLNDFILNAPKVEFLNNTRRENILAAAYGMRAYIYFTLLKTWGDVPIVLIPQTSIDFNNVSKKRSSKLEVMKLIKKDIKTSLDKFGAKYAFDGKRNYWSKDATLTLKGNVYIWSGTHFNGGTTDYTTAKNALEAVSNSSLLPEYGNVFKFSNKGNKEIIFALDYAVDESTNFYSMMASRTTELLGTFDQNGDSIIEYLGSTNAGNRYGLSEKVLLILNDTLDTRRDATMILLYKKKPASKMYKAKDTDYMASMINKFMGSIDAGKRSYVSDIPIYRYADVVLMIAEVKNLLGQDPTTEINMIRKRAYGTNFEISKQGFINGTKEENIKSILTERLKEFMAEGKRWWDLRRAGDKYVIDNNEYLFPGDEYKLVLPISKDMMGRNSALVQTAGY